MLVSQSKQNTVDLFETVSALDNTDISTLKDPSITYYIGATAILFLLFSAMQGASISIDERRNGLSDRLMVGPSGAFGMLSGKFVFLTLIGFVQAAIICAVAVIFFEVSITEKYVPIGIACLGTSVLASGLALLLANECSQYICRLTPLSDRRLNGPAIYDAGMVTRHRHFHTKLLVDRSLLWHFGTGTDHI